ncbi:hypothetical protein MC885_013638 [Smutsia gigantea]|nr:hypothetical protein MC885_013638 [Smutsia gigantea]
MAEMCDPEDPDGSKEIFEGRRSMQKSLGSFWNSRSLPVSRIQQSLQREKWDHPGSQCSGEKLGGRFRGGRGSQGCMTLDEVQEWGQNLGRRLDPLHEVLGAANVRQKQRQSGFEDILQQLTWMNATLAGLCRPCPWNWEFFQGNCYFFSQTKNIWKASVSACQDMKAQLVIVNTTEEQKFLTVWNIRNNQRIWIGLSDHHSEGAWKWVDDTPLLLSFWQEGEPNNHDNEDCGELSKNGWNDNKCSTENFWACKKLSTPCPEL